MGIIPALAVVAGLGGLVDGPRVEALPERRGDLIDVADEKARTILVVRSPTGIGRATITRTGDDWPEAVVFRLHLRGLEGFQIIRDGDKPLTLEAIDWSAGLGESGRFVVRALDAEGRPIPGRRPPEGGSFEVMLPRKFLDGNPKAFRVQWVDFYR